MPIEGELEQRGIADLLLQESNVTILLQLAKSLTKNVIEIDSNEEALKTVFMHMPSVHALLSKRAITKEILFKYVHSNQIPVTIDFTKSILINKIIEYWERGGPFARINNSITEINASQSESNSQPNTTQIEETQLPINLLARKFSEWFFENYNANNLKVEDFWKDSRLLLRIAATDCVNDQQCESAEQVIETLLGCKHQFSFFFNPNLSHDGVQGRMDVHGLVIVLVCGTLHTKDNCVGVFETSFGLMRDPFAMNNWKIKTIQSLLRSQGAPKEPRLSESDTLRASLALPAPTGEIS
ncbi:uncharacterized protein C3orf38 homolog [Episyrphus balteatus]|uniref:uncharacterized protein C3orf38 homolog n=1 Tax=Episyrphus balteatus TaxID=286459 RepID=UPI0024865FEE|nr:uncharacterized protein C3orf38 homolog [Episyrphus balteatus]